MLARFFIDRPIFAWVLSIVIVMAGGAAVITLPIAQYPDIAPPTVQVSCQYPGASAQVVRDTVAAPIEQQVNGVENMLYMSSQSTNDGGYNLTVTFALGANLDMAQVLVQNRVNQALPTLPEAVKALGVTTKKKSPSILLVVNLFSEEIPNTKDRYFDQLYLSNYATIQIRDELAKLLGVGDVTFLGQQDYSMRIWLLPDKLAARDLTTNDVVNSLREQNVQVAAGQLGQPPAPTGQDFQYTLTTLGRLTNEEEFANIVLKTGPGGAASEERSAASSVVRLKDVARIELGAKNQDIRSTLDGGPTMGIAIWQLPGSNALQTADRVKAKMQQLSERFPLGLKYAIVYDTTPFIEESVAEVFKTLRDAVILVALVVLLFLQDWKAVVLPLIDVGVSLIGTFAVMYALGFSLNNLTLFGLVLAIGIVVDDAIVVLENIERWLAKGLPVRDATIKAMDEITGPIIAITLVLSSVFLPSAFLGGITGQFYRQFALTIAASMIISATNAMTMTPARATSVFKDPVPGEEHGAHHEALPWWGVAGIGAYLVYTFLGGFVASLFGAPAPGAHGHEPAAALEGWRLWALNAVLWGAGGIGGYLLYRPVNSILGVLFKGFNVWFDWITGLFGKVVGGMLRLWFIVLFVYGGLVLLTYYGFTRTPVGFIPSQDKGYLVANIQLPDSASLERTTAIVQRVEQIAKETPGVEHTMGVHGQSLVLNAVSSNFGSMYIVLQPFHDRHGDHDRTADVVAEKIRRRCLQEIDEAIVVVFGAPPVDGLGSAGGFKLMVEDRGDLGLETLQGQTENLVEKGNESPGLVGLFNSFRSNSPQMYVDVDRVKCKSLGVSLNDVFATLQANLGSVYVNDFNRFGRTWQVNVQADSAYRLRPEVIKQLKVRNIKGEMVSLGAVADIEDSTGPVMITRYNMFTAAAINGSGEPGVSTGTVLKTMDDLAECELPRSMLIEWTELTYMQTLEGNAAVYAFVGAVLLVFFVLAAQYESWSMPAAVILVVPMCLLCAIAGVVMAHMDINIFVQVGFIVLVGLACKNAILVVEFAREQQAKEGKSAYDAALNAAITRLRPIIMTSFAFILGVLPLVIAQGAGAEMRRTLGTAVFAGMIGVTAFGVFLTPVFYLIIEKFNTSRTEKKP